MHSVVPENSRQKMVYSYLANTVPTLEVSMHSGWPVFITVLIIQADSLGLWFTSYTLVASVLIDHSCATRKPLAAIVITITYILVGYKMFSSKVLHSEGSAFSFLCAYRGHL